jgi:protein ImuA
MAAERRLGRWRCELYPPGLQQLGTPLGRLLVIRTHHALDLLWACEQALRCRAIGAVIAKPERLDAYSSRRLQLAAETGGGLALLLRDAATMGRQPTFAASRLQFDPVTNEWSPGRESAGRRMQVTVLKLREAAPGATTIMELPDATHHVPASAVPVDRPTPPARSAIAG